MGAVLLWRGTQVIVGGGAAPTAEVCAPSHGGEGVPAAARESCVRAAWLHAAACYDVHQKGAGGITQCCSVTAPTCCRVRACVWGSVTALLFPCEAACENHAPACEITVCMSPGATLRATMKLARGAPLCCGGHVPGFGRVAAWPF